MLRAFVAVALAPDVVDRLTGLVGELKKCGADVRWVRPEGMHLTLRFLGDIEEGCVGELLEGLARGVSSLPSLRLGTAGLGAFPSLKRPRVIWVGCRGEGLGALAAATEKSISELGFPREERPFRPHVTLGRVRSGRNWKSLEGLLDRRLDCEFGESKVCEVILFRSELTRDGARYSRLGSVRLAADASR